MLQTVAYRQDLQLLRGLSVLLVVFYHLGIPGFKNGFLGVDIFFVISGFLMATQAVKFNVFEFYQRRFSRLIPAYLTVVFITTLAVIFIAVPVDANQRLERVYFDLGALTNIAMWAEHTYFVLTSFKPLLNLWSLAVELQFYLIAPFLLPFLSKRKHLLIALACISFIASITIITFSPKTSFFMLPTRLWEFLFGAYAAWFTVSFDEKKITQFLRYFSLFCITLVIAIYPLPYDSRSVLILTGHPSFASLIVVMATAVLLVLRFDKLVSIGSWVSKGFIKLGDYSYSIYLTHFPIIVLVNYIPFGGTVLGIQSVSQLFLIIILTVVSTYLLYKYVENLRFSHNIVIPTIVLFIGCLGLGLFGSKINSYRYSEKEMLIFNAWEDKGTWRCGKIFRLFNPYAKICPLSEKDNTERVLLLGNSHANSIKDSFDRVMVELGYSTYFYVNSRPLMSDLEGAERVKNAIVKNKIDYVVIHKSAWFFDKQGNLDRLKSLLELLEKSGISVFFIAPIPVYTELVPRAMFSALEDSNYSFPITDHAKYYVKSSGFFSFIEKNNIHKNRIAYPLLTLCPTDECIYQKDGVPYYYDSNHLTLTATSFLEPFLRDSFLQFKAIDN